MNHSGTIIEVAVAYELKEYMRVLRDFIPVDVAATGEKPNRLLPWNWPLVERALFSILVPIVFIIKKSVIGSCIFTFSEAGFSRRSKSGSGSRAWSDVKVVHRLSNAYLIELSAGGAIPIPYRVLTPSQRQTFESLTQRVGRGAV